MNYLELIIQKALLKLKNEFDSTVSCIDDEILECIIEDSFYDFLEKVDYRFGYEKVESFEYRKMYEILCLIVVFKIDYNQHDFTIKQQSLAGVNVTPANIEDFKSREADIDNKILKYWKWY